MWRLIGAGPDVDVADVEMLALERSRAGFRPCLHDQVVGLLVALVRPMRVDAGRMVFVADAAHEAGDDRPRDRLSSIANSSAMLTGLFTSGSARPMMAIFALLVRAIRLAAIRFGAGMMT